MEDPVNFCPEETLAFPPNTGFLNKKKKKKLFFNIYSLLRDRQSTSMGGAERGEDTESEAGFRLQAVSTEPDVGLEPMSSEIMT